jgi:hypothetical protein
MHPKSVHTSWPLAEMARMNRLNKTRCASQMYRRANIRRLQRFFMNKNMIAKCEAWRPNILKGSWVINYGEVLRLVARYHETRKSLGANLRSLVDAWSGPTAGLTHELGRPVIQIVAFSKAGRNLEGRLFPDK